MEQYYLYVRLPSGATYQQQTTREMWIAQERAAGFIGGGDSRPATGGWSKSIGGFTVGGSIKYVKDEVGATDGEVSGAAPSAPELVA